MVARRTPTRELRGLRATFRITRSTAWWLYACRFCSWRYEWQVLDAESFLRLPLGKRMDIQAHARSHRDV